MMKAYKVFDRIDWEGLATVVFAESANNAILLNIV